MKSLSLANTIKISPQTLNMSIKLFSDWKQKAHNVLKFIAGQQWYLCDRMIFFMLSAMRKL